MKKFILIAAFAAFPVASMAATTTACAAGAGTAIASDATGASFVRVGFTPVCSANIIVRFDQNNTVLWGGAGSTKGKNAFRGSTDGGSVKAHTTDCGTNGCAEGEVDAAVTASAPAGT